MTGQVGTVFRNIMAANKKIEWDDASKRIITLEGASFTTRVVRVPLKTRRCPSTNSHHSHPQSPRATQMNKTALLFAFSAIATGAGSLRGVTTKVKRGASQDWRGRGRIVVSSIVGGS